MRFPIRFEQAKCKIKSIFKLQNLTEYQEKVLICLIMGRDVLIDAACQSRKVFDLSKLPNRI